MDSDSPPPPADAPPPRPSWLAGLLCGGLTGVSLYGLSRLALVLSYQSGCDEPTIPCVASSRELLGQATMIAAALALFVGVVIGFCTAFAWPRAKAIMGSGCAILFALFFIFTVVFAMLVPGLEMMERLLR